ncbi:MAG TPA: hypothetical protein VGQ62_21850 [Chloroflexota bacterium]|nr:hypothetical protein [Chloroflexota bacterium]
MGAVGLAALALGGILGDPSGAFRAYLVGYAFWLGLALGSIGVVFIQFLTGGMWGLLTRRVFEAGAATLPLFAVLFVPLLFGLPRLYIWAQPDAVAADPILQHKALYLNVPFFIIRAAIYLVVWCMLALRLRRLSAAHDRGPDTGEHSLAALRALQTFSVVGVLILALTVSFAAIDWLMSLDADWYSTMYPPLVGAGHLLLALACGIVVATRLAPSTVLRDIATPRIWNDLGSLLLAFLMLWAYMAYFQYLLMWAGNLSDEIPWYLRRIDGGWRAVAVVLAVLGFGVPFCGLLFRPLKRNPRTLALIAALIAIMQVVNVYWLAAPPFAPDGPRLDWLPAAAVVGVGGVWVAAFSWQLATRPLLPLRDPRLVPAVEAAREPG